MLRVCNIKKFPPCCCILQMFNFTENATDSVYKLIQKPLETLKLWAGNLLILPRSLGSLFLNAYHKFGFNIVKITLKRPNFRWCYNSVWSVIIIMIDTESSAYRHGKKHQHKQQYCKGQCRSSVYNHKRHTNDCPTRINHLSHTLWKPMIDALNVFRETVDNSAGWCGVEK